MILLIVVFAVLIDYWRPVGLSLLGSSVAYLVASGYSLPTGFSLLQAPSATLLP